jgi:hypothetical protein
MVSHHEIIPALLHSGVVLTAYEEADQKFVKEDSLSSIGD